MGDREEQKVTYQGSHHIRTSGDVTCVNGSGRWVLTCVANTGDQVVSALFKLMFELALQLINS